MSEHTEAATSEQPEWAYFDEALCWYPGHNLTGAQRFSVVEQVRQALADGRITPADLGLVEVVRTVLDENRCGAHGLGPKLAPWCVLPRGHAGPHSGRSTDDG